MDEPPRRQDPLALLVLGGAVVVVVGLGLFLLHAVRTQPAPQSDAAAAVPFTQQVRDAIRKLIAPAPVPAPAPVAKAPAAKPQAQPQAKAAPPDGRILIEAGRMWRYNVTVEPPAWKDVTLTYRSALENGAIGVRTEFLYTGGKSAFHLGVFAPNHSSHANTRFPGFFMYAAYLTHPLQPGQRIVFGWPWQGGTKPGRVKRFEGQMTGWEEVQLPSGKITAAKIDGNLLYVEEGKVQASVRETFWYAPKVSQVVKILRDGRSPDEGVTRIAAELAEYR